METITKDLSYKDLVHLVREEADAGKALEQQFSAFLMLQPFNTGDPPTIKLFFCYFITVYLLLL